MYRKRLPEAHPEIRPEARSAYCTSRLYSVMCAGSRLLAATGLLDGQDGKAEALLHFAPLALLQLM